MLIKRGSDDQHILAYLRSYNYYSADRRKTMTVLGQPKLTYTYDNADRLTQIVQDAGPSNNNVAQTIRFAYDNDNRRTQVTLANGTKINTSYDNADQITAISYTKADGTSLGNLTYSYDGKGRRTGVGGTLTSTELPTAVTDPLYDANNRLTRWNGKTFQYDANGNLINDGERSYSWNARDELQGLGGTQSASFRYDPMGRRSAKTISTTTTGYLYDGMDFVQELAGTTSTSSVRANLITGGLDEPLLRITGTGSAATLSHFFSDANNNVIALTDSTQAIATKYSYGAYGQSKQTTVSGATNTNSQQYTGRENDGTGLMYYRARYYHVGCARFISEDPIGWASGQTNGYAYVGGDPISFTDPSGNAPGDCKFGLPDNFWNWYHRQHKKKGDADIDKEEAKELAKEWERLGRPGPDSKKGGRNRGERQRGYISPQIIPWLVRIGVVITAIATPGNIGQGDEYGGPGDLGWSPNVGGYCEIP